MSERFRTDRRTRGSGLEPGDETGKVPGGNGGDPPRTPPPWRAFDPEFGPVPPEALPEPDQGGAAPRIVALTPTPGAAGTDWSARAAVRLAREWGRVGFRCVLIDLSVRRPTLHRILGLGNDRGIMNVVHDGIALGAAARSSNDGTFHLIPVGRTRFAAARPLLEHVRWTEVLRSFRKANATVLLYLPTTTPGADKTLSEASDIVVLDNGDEMLPVPVDLSARTRVRAILGRPPRAAIGGR